jgi:hypothetical protein
LARAYLAFGDKTLGQDKEEKYITTIVEVRWRFVVLEVRVFSTDS